MKAEDSKYKYILQMDKADAIKAGLNIAEKELFDLLLYFQEKEIEFGMKRLKVFKKLMALGYEDPNSVARFIRDNQ